MNEEEPWTVAEMEAVLVSASVRGKRLAAARAVLEELHRLGAGRPTVEVRAASVAIDPPQREPCGITVDRAGVVRVWVWLPSATFGEPDQTWRMRGKDVAHVLHEFAVRAWLPLR